MASNRGNDAVRGILRGVRVHANTRRLCGGQPSEFMQGLYIGQIIMAAVYLDADPIAVQAAENEASFLCGPYMGGEA